MYRLKMIILILISIFFTVMGIDLLVSAYRLTDPFSFIITFFAANLMILISLTLCLGFALRLRRSFSTATADDTSSPQRNDSDTN